MKMGKNRQNKRIEFALGSRFDRVEYLAPRFFREILRMDYDNVIFVSDLSDIRDFPAGKDVVAVLRRFEEHYFLDPSRAESTHIVHLLELLDRNGVSA